MSGLLREWVRLHSGRILLGFALFFVASLVCATQLRIDASVGRLMMVGDPALERNRALKAEFSNDEAIVVAFDLGRPFTAQDLRSLQRIVEQIEAIDEIEHVVALSNVEDVRGVPDGLDASALVDFETLEADLPAIHARVKNHPLYHRNLVTEDLSVLGLVAQFVPDLAIEAAARPTRLVLEVIEANGMPGEAHATGFPVASDEANRLVTLDLAVLIPVAIIVILTVLYLTLRQRNALWLFAALTLWSEGVTMGWLGLSDTPLDLATTMIPSLVLVTASTYVIYFLGLCRNVADSEHPGVAVVDLLTRPVSLSGASTSIGFLFLRANRVEAISDLGTCLAVGIVASVFGTLLLLPALVHRYKIDIRSAQSRRFDAWATKGVEWARRPWLPISVAALIALVLVPGLARIRIDTTTTQYFSDDHPVRVGTDFVHQRLSSPYITNLVIRTNEPDGALDPAVLGLAQSVIERLDGGGKIDRAISFLDYMVLMDAAMRPGEIPSAVPASAEIAAQYLLLYEAGGDPEDFRHYINHDRSALNVFLRNKNPSSGMMVLESQVHEIAESAPPDVEVDLLGTAHLFNYTLLGLAEGVVRGLAMALVAIVIIIAIVVRSIKLALVSALVNVLPITVCGGLLGWLGLELDLGTSIVGCAALGLAVDDTAHVIGHLEKGRSLESVYALVGRPLMLTTLALGLGFLSLVAAQFATIVVMGAATALTLMVALLADLLLLPSLLVLIGYERS